MTPILHSPEQRVAFPVSGHPVPRYGRPGDVCAGGCGTVLRRSNKYDTCSACVIAGAEAQERPRDRSVTAPRPCDESPGFMAPGPRATREEIELAAGNRRKNGEAKSLILAYLAKSRDWCSCKAIAKATGVSNGSASFHLHGLHRSGKIESKFVPDYGGMWLWRTPQDSAAAEDTCGNGSEVPTAPATTPVPPPATGDAEDAAAPGPPPPGPPPFAGIDLELYTIGEVLHLIERLGGEERRRRVAAYVAARFL